MIRTKNSGEPRTVVSFYNPTEGKSYSITVYSGDTRRVAREAAEHLARLFRCTELNDRRHKRRF